MSRRILCALAAMMMTSAPATAMSQPGESAGAPGAVGSIYQVGQCVVRRDRALAIALLEAMPIDSEPRLQDAARMISNSGCLSGPLPENFPVFLRGAIAQEMLLRDYPEPGAEPYSLQRLIDLRLPAQIDGESADEIARRYRWSDCVVRNDKSNFELLIRAPVGSERERKILMRMRPYMSACMGQQAQFAASAPEIRSLFMQSGYQMLYRHWNGQLKGAGLVSVENREGRLICRTYVSTDSRVRTEKICMTPRDWARADLRTREELEVFISRSVSRPF